MREGLYQDMRGPWPVVSVVGVVRLDLECHYVDQKVLTIAPRTPEGGTQSPEGVKDSTCSRRFAQNSAHLVVCNQGMT